MSEPLIPMTPADADIEESADGARRRQLMILGGVAGVAVLGVGAFALMSGGSSSDNSAVPLVHHAVPVTASATPSASPSAQSVLQTYHGSVGDRDPFAIPAAVLAATAPKAAPAGAAVSASAPAGTAVVTPTTAVSQAPGTIVVPVVTDTTGTTDTAGATAIPTVAPAPDQYLQLLSAREIASGWVVSVRSAHGVANAVKPGTKNVDGTLFYYQGEDETSGKPTFVFTVGESQGGNLTPNSKESAKKPHADKSTLILHEGVVDGGIYAE